VTKPVSLRELVAVIEAHLPMLHPSL
jgi:hypothetical protein